jgi:hypothetical protein
MLRSGTILSALILIVATFSGCAGGASKVPPQQAAASPTATPPPPTASIAISSISPDTVAAGSADLTLTITGTNLDLEHSGSPQSTRTVATWSNGTLTSLPAMVVSASQIIVVAPSALLAAPGTASIAIQKWFKADDSPFAASNSLAFTITPDSAPSVVPAADTLGVNGRRQFVAAGFGKDSGVNWRVEEGAAGGAITSDGYFTAPATSGTFHVVATSMSDANKNAAAVVTVTNAGFAPSGTMHVPRTGHTATLLEDGKVLVVGGGDVTAELFDPASGTFSFTGPPVTGRLKATATLLADGKVLIAGGLGLTAGPDGFLPLLNTAEIFDPATGAFSSTETMVQARRQHTAILLEDGRVLVAGGYAGHICFTAGAELFDPATGMFSPTGGMHSERVGHTATLLASGEVLVAGGSNGCAPDAADDPPWDPLFAELYEPSSGSFQVAGSMSTTRIHHAAVRLDNGTVLVLGGIPAVQNLHEPVNPSYAELYDRKSDAFSPIAGLTISPMGYTATLMTSGLVLITGGETSTGGPTTEVQLLDPRSGVLTPTGGLGTARVGHTATLLKDGRVLVTGGSDSKGNALATAELYK